MQIAIVIFCYNRRDKLVSLLNSLACNDLVEINKFYIFQDGIKAMANEAEIKEHSELKEIWNNFANVNGIKDHEFILRNKNIGLRESIIDGLDTVFEIYDAAIILEDDLQLAPSFTRNMLSLIYKYSDNPSIGHLNGWSNYQTFKFQRNQLVHTSMMYCWGWATWKPYWINFRKNFNWNRKRFTIFKHLKYDYLGLGRLIYQMKLNWNGQIKTWAVFWYLYLREENLICAGYADSLTKNVGNDGSGENCKKIDSALFSKVLNGEISSLIEVENTVKTYHNALFFVNLILFLCYRNFYLLLRKILK